MKKSLAVFCLVLAAFALSGCANGYGYGYPPSYGWSNHKKAIAGAAIGAAGGALIGGAVTRDGGGAAVGGLLGGVAGGLIGHSMDKKARPRPYYPGDYDSRPYYGERRGRYRYD